MDKHIEDVLQELKNVGAVGVPWKGVVSVEENSSPLEDVLAPLREMKEVGSSSLPPLLQSSFTAKSLDDAIVATQVASEALRNLGSSLVALRSSLGEIVPSLEEPVGSVNSSREVGSELVGALGVNASSAGSITQVVRPTEELLTSSVYEEARLAALRKIRGEGLFAATLAATDEEDVPFVGQVRALPIDQEPGEVSLGTVGVIKSEF